MGHHYRPARFEDCREIAPLMREQDAKEVMASQRSSSLLRCSCKSPYRSLYRDE